MEDLTRKLRRVYRQATEELEQSLAEFEAGHKQRDARMRKKLAEGKITKQYYDRWKRGQVFQGKQWRAKLDSAARTLEHADEEAAKIMNRQRIGIFTEAANEELKTASIITGVDFNVYDQRTVDRMLREEPNLLPPRRVKKAEDVEWYHQLISNAVTRSIIAGDSIEGLAHKIARETGEKSWNAAKRNARTAMTAAQNAGRLESMHEVKARGIKVQKKWLAAHDSRVRDTHRVLDGQTKEVDEPFEVAGMEIMYPGDPAAHPSLVYNCRCTLLYVYPEYENGKMPEPPDGLTEDMSGEELARVMFNQSGGKIDLKSEPVMALKGDLRQAISGEGWRDEDTRYYIIDNEGREYFIGSDTTQEQLKAARHVISSKKAVYVKESNADGETDTLGVSTGLGYTPTGKPYPDSTHRLRVFDAVLDDPEKREAFGDEVARLFKEKQKETGKKEKLSPLFTLEDYDRELKRLREERRRIMMQDEYDRSVTEALRERIFELEDRRQAFVFAGEDERLVVELTSGDGKRVGDAVNEILNSSKYSLPVSGYRRTEIVDDGYLGAGIAGQAGYDGIIKICKEDESVLQTHIHENLHERSVSKRPDGAMLYSRFRHMEEGSVEYLTEEIVQMTGIIPRPTYAAEVRAIRTIHDAVSPGTSHYDFAKWLFDMPLEARYTELEELTFRITDVPTRKRLREALDQLR